MLPRHADEDEESRTVMAERRTTMMDPPIETLLEKVDSKYTLVSLAAKRGREVNSYFNQLVRASVRSSRPR